MPAPTARRSCASMPVTSRRWASPSPTGPINVTPATPPCRARARFWCGSRHDPSPPGTVALARVQLRIGRPLAADHDHAVRSRHRAVLLARRDEHDIAGTDRREPRALLEPAAAFEHEEHVLRTVVLMLRKLGVRCVADVVQRDVAGAAGRIDEHLRLGRAHAKRLAVAVDVADERHGIWFQRRRRSESARKFDDGDDDAREHARPPTMPTMIRAVYEPPSLL